MGGRTRTVDERWSLDASTGRLVAAGLAFLIAIVHLYWGMPRLTAYLMAGTMPDPRPPLFVLSGVAILVGVSIVAAGGDRRPIYVAGIALMLTYLLGYVAWHTVLDHGGFWPWGPGGHAHGGNPVVVIAQHLLADPLALVSKAAELCLLVLLVVLYRREA